MFLDNLSSHKSSKLISHCSNELCCPISFLATNLVGTMKGSSSNLHCQQCVGKWILKSFDTHSPSSSPNHMSFFRLCQKRGKGVPQVVFVYIFITWSIIFVGFQNCYKKKSVQKKVSEKWKYNLRKKLYIKYI